MKETVVVSRKWKSPQVRAFINAEEIGAEMLLDDFLASLVEAIGNPTLLVTKAALAEKMKKAAAAILTEMKEQTARVL